MLKLRLLICIPLFASIVGAWIANSIGVSSVAFLPNFIAGILGAALLFRSQWVAEFSIKNVNLIAISTLALIGASLLFVGIDSVHRWIPLGPFRLNVSMAFTPLILFTSVYGHKNWTPFLMVFLALIFVFQPDAGQATAFTSAAITILIFDKSKHISIRLGIALCLISLTILAWTRPDPLTAIAHVEQILHLAYLQGPWHNITALFAIIVLISPFAWLSFKGSLPKAQILSRSYLVSLLISYVVTEYGNFPVPILGAGAATVFGWALALTLLMHQEQLEVI